MKKNLVESARIVSEKSVDGTYKVRLINSGVGSSGFYSPELLRNYHDVFDGVPSYFNHISEWEDRDTRTLAGKIVGETWIEEEEDGTVGVYGNYLPRQSSEIGDLFENFRDVVALSIFASGTGVENDEGIYEVQAFTREWPWTSVDIVDAAGRGGKFAEALKRASESAGSVEAQATAESINGTKETILDKAEILEIVNEAVSAAIAPLAESLDAIKEYLTPAESVSDETVDEAATVEAAFEAGLVKEQRKAVVEAVRKGANAADAIAEQKAIIEAVRSSLKSDVAVGRVGGDGEHVDLTIGRWHN